MAVGKRVRRRIRLGPQLVRRYEHIPINVEAIVLAGQNHTAVIHQCNVKALGMLDLALQCGHQLPVLGEYGQIEVVVIVSDKNFASRINTNTNWIIGDAFAANLTQKDTLVAEHLNAMGAIVADENFLFIIDDDAIGELKMLAAPELLQYISGLIENNDTHDLALHDDNYLKFINILIQYK